MKKISKTLSLFGISLVSLGGVSALMLPLTSCGEPGIPNAPGTFIFTDEIAQSTWWKKMSTIDDSWKVKGSGLVFANAMSDSNFYSDNLIKWDIIANWSWNLGGGTIAHGGTMHFDLFERNGINVKYQLSGIVMDTEPLTIKTSSLDTDPGAPQFVPMTYYGQRLYTMHTDYKATPAASLSTDAFNYGYAYLTNSNTFAS